MSVGKVLVYTTFPLGGLIWDVVESATKKIDTAASGEMAALELEAARQNVRLALAKTQAQIAQELAIAKRIETAEEVEIEEFYEASGKGNVGVNVGGNSGAATLGLGGEGRRVTKRVFHFRGWREGTVVVSDQSDEVREALTEGGHRGNAGDANNA